MTIFWDQDFPRNANLDEDILRFKWDIPLFQSKRIMVRLSTTQKKSDKVYSLLVGSTKPR